MLDEHVDEVLRAAVGFQRATLGLLVALGGFTGGVEQKQARAASERVVIVLIDRSDLDAWIDAPDRVVVARSAPLDSPAGALTPALERGPAPERRETSHCPPW